MIWVAWRQFRTQLLVTLGVLALFAVAAIAIGVHLRDAYSFCLTQHDCAPPSGATAVLSGLLGPALLAMPALLGMFWGAPLVARELESGTHRLAWTQSVTRRRWLAVRVALVGVAVLAVAAIASWLVSWALAPLVAIKMNHFDPSMFTARGIVAIGYAAFAFALGVTAGALTRRTLPAMATMLIGFVGARLAFTLWVRPHLLASKQTVESVALGKGVGFVGSASGVSLAAGAPPMPNVWTLSTTLVDRAHHVLSTARLHGLLVSTCPKITTFPAGSAKANAVADTCQLKLSHYLVQLVVYQPQGHYWPLQGLETGIFIAAALALIGVAIWCIGPRPVRERAVTKAPERAAHLVATKRS